MFAYCNNNPVSNVDPTGHALMQMRFDPDGASGMLTPGPWGSGSGVAYAAGAVSSFSKEEFIEDVVNSKVYQIAEAFVSNVEASVGFGMGLRGSMTVLEWIGLDLGISYDLVSVTLSDGRIYVDQRFWQGLEVDLITIKIDESESGKRAFGSSTWETIPPSDAIDILSGSVYLYAGGSYSISLRANSLFAELDEILFG